MQERDRTNCVDHNDHGAEMTKHQLGEVWLSPRTWIGLICVAALPLLGTLTGHLMIRYELSQVQATIYRLDEHTLAAQEVRADIKERLGKLPPPWLVELVKTNAQIVQEHEKRLDRLEVPE